MPEVHIPVNVKDRINVRLLYITVWKYNRQKIADWIDKTKPQQIPILSEISYPILF